MTRNNEEVYPEVGGFSGFNVAVDPQDLPSDKLLWCENAVCDRVLGEVHTRPGWGRVIEEPFNRPFRVMGGSRGGRIGSDLELYDLALRNGGWRGYFDTDDYALTLNVYPAKNIVAGSTYVLFTVGSSMSDLGITQLNWAFDYIAGLQTSADIQTYWPIASNQYDDPGMYDVRVWGTGSDGNTYSAYARLEVRESAEVGVWDFSFDEAAVDIVSFAEDPAALPSTGGTIEISWETEYATRVIVTDQGADTAAEAYHDVGQTGELTFDITESTYYTIEAQGETGPVLRELLVPVDGSAAPSTVWTYPPWGMGDGGRAPGQPPQPPGGGGGGGGGFPPGGGGPGGGGPGGGGVGPAGGKDADKDYVTNIWLICPEFVVDGATFAINVGAPINWVAKVDGTGAAGEVALEHVDKNCTLTLTDNPVDCAGDGDVSTGSTTGRADLSAGKSRGKFKLMALGGGQANAGGDNFRAVTEKMTRTIKVVPSDLHIIMDVEY